MKPTAIACLLENDIMPTLISMLDDCNEATSCRTTPFKCLHVEVGMLPDESSTNTTSAARGHSGLAVAADVVGDKVVSMVAVSSTMVDVKGALDVVEVGCVVITCVVVADSVVVVAAVDIFLH